MYKKFSLLILLPLQLFVISCQVYSKKTYLKESEINKIVMEENDKTLVTNFYRSKFRGIWDL